MELEFDISEINYTDKEENLVIKEIRLGLMWGEISRRITKRKLIDWFAKMQIQRRNWCVNITCLDLINIAQECGLEVIWI